MGILPLLVGLVTCAPTAVVCDPQAQPARHSPLIDRHFDYAATMPPALRSRAAAIDTLQLQDRIAIQRKQADELRLNGPVDLTLSAVRVSGGPGGSGGLWRSDRYTMLSLGAAASVDVGPVQLRASVANASVRRKRDLLPTPARRLSTDISTAGLEVSHGAGPALGVDYLRIGRARGRRLFNGPDLSDVGGLIAGQGVRLFVGDRRDEGEGVAMGWRVSLSSLHRPVTTLRLGEEQRLDTQAEARWTLSF